MKTIFSTDSVKKGDRFSYWHEVACRYSADHECRPLSRETFEAHVRAEAIADIDLATFEASPHRFVRTRRHVSNTASDKMVLIRPTSGELHLEQDGRSALVRAGQVALLDPRRPHTGDYAGAACTLVARVPRDGLEARLGSLHAMNPLVVSPHGAEDDFLSSFLATLPRHAGRLDTVLEDIVQEQIVDLLAASCAKALGWRAGSTNSTLTRLRLHAAVDASLSDPELNVRDIAARAGVSVRYANQVLAAENTSIMRLVLARRLARCRAAFEDPAQNHRTISEIAYSWGFSDMTHFARAFATAFGVLPRDFRQMARSRRFQKA